MRANPRPHPHDAPFAADEGMKVTTTTPSGADAPNQPKDGAKPSVSPAYANYVLGVLFVVMMFNFLDRQIIAIVAEPIKRDLGLSDTQLGLLSGLSFAVIYTLAGIPIAALSDRWNRTRIITISLSIWSLMTVLCGFVTNFVQLFLARVGVGVGEAGSGPASHSLIADLFPPEKRAGALGIYGMAVPIGAFIAFAAGGWAVDAFGWRTAFILAGAPGLILAVFVVLTVRETRPAMPFKEALKPDPSRVDLKTAMKELSGKRAYWHIIAAGTLYQFGGYGITAFYGSFFVRVHEMSYTDFGLKLGLMVLIAGSFGSWVGGQISDRLARRSVARPYWVTALVVAASVPITITALYLPDGNMAILTLSAVSFAGAFLYGPMFSGLQLLARNETRAMAVAIFYFISTLIGLGLGPLFVGIVSDLAAGPDATPAALASGLRFAMAAAALTYIWCALHFWWASRTIIAEANEGRDAATSH